MVGFGRYWGRCNAADIKGAYRRPTARPAVRPDAAEARDRLPHTAEPGFSGAVQYADTHDFI